VSALSLSVVIPTHNRAQYLPDAVDSALAQVGVEVDVIIVDNESTDDTAAVVERHAPRWGKRVRYLWQENAERSAARNTGLRRADGEFIAFLDSDDIWRPHHARTCLTALREDPEVAVAYGEYGLIAADRKVICNQVPRIASENEQFRRDLCLKQLIIHPTEAVIRRSMLADHYVFDPEIVGGEDWLLWVALAARAPFHGVGVATVWKRVHPHGTSVETHRLTGGLMRAAETVVDTGLPRELGIPSSRIRAINQMHCAYAYYLSGKRREVSRLLLAALREWPGVLRERDFWRVCGRLCVGTHLSRRIRAARHRDRGRAIEVTGHRAV
jgi:hypothetical protein